MQIIRAVRFLSDLSLTNYLKERKYVSKINCSRIAALTFIISAEAAVLPYVIPSPVNYSSFSGPSINYKLAGTGYVGMRSGHSGLSFNGGFTPEINSALLKILAPMRLSVLTRALLDSCYSTTPSLTSELMQPKRQRGAPRRFRSPHDLAQLQFLTESAT